MSPSPVAALYQLSGVGRPRRDASGVEFVPRFTPARYEAWQPCWLDTVPTQEYRGGGYDSFRGGFVVPQPILNPGQRTAFLAKEGAKVHLTGVLRVSEAHGRYFATLEPSDGSPLSSSVAAFVPNPRRAEADLIGRALSALYQPFDTAASVHGNRHRLHTVGVDASMSDAEVGPLLELDGARVEAWGCFRFTGDLTRGASEEALTWGVELHRLERAA